MADTTTYRINEIEAWIEANPGRRITATSIAKHWHIDTRAASNYLCRIRPRNPHFKKVAPGVIMYDPDNTTPEYVNDVDKIHNAIKRMKNASSADLQIECDLTPIEFNNAMSVLRKRADVHIERTVMWKLLGTDAKQTKMLMGESDEG